jgi:hypothetical protein
MLAIVERSLNKRGGKENPACVKGDLLLSFPL